MKRRPSGPKAISVVPLNAFPEFSGCPPTSISISFSPCGEYFNTTELDASTVQTLPCGSIRMLCGILYRPFPQERSKWPSRSTTRTGSAFSPRWSVARIEASLSGASLCPRGGAAYSQGRSRDHSLRRNRMKLDDSSPVERKEVECAAKRWAHHSYRNASCRSPEQTDRESRQTTCNWLRFAGRLRESDRTPAPHQQEIDALCRHKGPLRIQRYSHCRFQSGA
jgi:hypothetical protein